MRGQPTLRATLLSLFGVLFVPAAVSAFLQYVASFFPFTSPTWYEDWIEWWYLVTPSDTNSTLVLEESRIGGSVPHCSFRFTLRIGSILGRPDLHYLFDCPSSCWTTF